MALAMVTLAAGASADGSGGSDGDTLEPTVNPSGLTLTVNTVADHDGACTVADCTLREALKAANRQAGADTILFNIPAGQAINGAFVIAPDTPLPHVTDPVTIDATSQAGYAGLPVVVLTGAPAAQSGVSTDGLVITAGDSVVRGLAVNGFALNGIVLRSNGSNHIEGCVLGINAANSTFQGNTGSGVLIDDSPGNVIGGLTPKPAGSPLSPSTNFISGNGHFGVVIQGSASDQNVLQTNGIGIGFPTVSAVPNADGGVLVEGGDGNLIGTPSSVSGLGSNVISGNGGSGIWLNEDADRNSVQVNMIGTGFNFTTGQAEGAVLNSGAGILVSNSNDNQIGGAASPSGPGPSTTQIVAGNGASGITIQSVNFGIASGNVVRGNYIGVLPTFANNQLAGVEPLGNATNGVEISNAANNIIGDTRGQDSFTPNVIGANGIDGISIAGLSASGNRIERNFIGLVERRDLDPQVVKAVGNVRDGIHINGAPKNVIGGRANTEHNTISANGDDGIDIRGTDSTGNVIIGNGIGTNRKRNQDFGNMDDGISLNAVKTVIGGIGQGNTISGNGDDGIDITASGSGLASGNRLIGNFIGTNANGTTRLGNDSDGIAIDAGPNNLIGGSAAGEGNVIAANGDDGIDLSDVSGLRILGNFIGTGRTGQSMLGNTDKGIVIDDSENVIIGGVALDGKHAEGGNRIAFNGFAGVSAVGSTNGVTIRGNAIYTNGKLGIDLRAPNENADFVNPNDRLDADSGTNGLQNFPELSTATAGATTTDIIGRLNSQPDTQFFLDFYANTQPDPSGFGEGERYLGRFVVTTNSRGNAVFLFKALNAPYSQYITVTATNSDTGDTSEFSHSVHVR